MMGTRGGRAWGTHLVIVVAWLLAGCGAPPELDPLAEGLEEVTETPSPTTGVASTDVDRDGWTREAGDCDDLDPDTSPDAEERCGDAQDNNCDGFTDEPSAADALRWYHDGDGDGFGDPGIFHTACAPFSGFVAAGTDCDDGADTIHPDAAERCDDDGADTNCDGDPDRGAEDAPCAADEAPCACPAPSTPAP